MAGILKNFYTLEFIKARSQNGRGPGFGPYTSGCFYQLRANDFVACQLLYKNGCRILYSLIEISGLRHYGEKHVATAKTDAHHICTDSYATFYINCSAAVTNENHMEIHMADSIPPSLTATILNFGLIAFIVLLYVVLILAAWFAIWKLFLNKYNFFRMLFGLPPLLKQKHLGQGGSLSSKNEPRPAHGSRLIS